MAIDLSELKIEAVGIRIPATPDKVTEWNVKSLHNLFGLEEWSNTQLYSILKELDLLNTPHTIAGGCLVRHLMKTEICKGDIDVYPLNEKAADALKREYEAKGYKVQKSKYSYWFEHKIGARKIKVQIMHKNAAPMLSVLSSFDFEHCRVAYRQGRFYSTMGATTAIAQRKLHLRHITQPDYSLLRALKYKSLGFNADKAITQLAIMINRDEKGVNACEWEEKNPIVEY